MSIGSTSMWFPGISYHVVLPGPFQLFTKKVTPTTIFLWIPAQGILEETEINLGEAKRIICHSLVSFQFIIMTGTPYPAPFIIAITVLIPCKAMWVPEVGKDRVQESAEK